MRTEREGFLGVPQKGTTQKMKTLKSPGQGKTVKGNTENTENTNISRDW